MERQDFPNAIVQTVREPLLVLDGDLRVQLANRAFCRRFEVSPEQTHGRLVYDLGNGQWDIPALRTLLEDILPRNSHFDDFEVEHDFPGIGRRTMLLNARRLVTDVNPAAPAANGRELILLAFEDVTDRHDAQAALRASEQKYRDLFESIDEGFCTIEFFDGPHGPLSDYVHVEANPAYTANAGIPDIVGRKVREMVPDEADGWVEIYRNVLLTGQPVRFERELVATGRYLELAAFRVEPPARRQVAVLFKDVTDRRRAQEALRESKEKFSALFAASPAPFLILKPDAPRFTIVEVNAAYLAATMRTREALVGRGVFEAFPDDPGDATSTSVSTLRASFERVLATHQPDTLPDLKYDIARPDGTFEQRWWSPVNSAVLDENGEVAALIHNANDVTEQYRAKAALRESEERYRTLIGQVKDYAIFATDVRGRATTWNEGVQRVLGFEKHEFIGQDITEAIFTPEDLASGAAAQELETAAATGAASNDRWMRRKNGERFFATGVTTALRDDGTLIGFTKVMRDQTDKAQAVEALHENQEKLRFTLATIKGGDWDLDLLTGKATCSFRHDQCFGATEPIPDWSYEKFLTYVHPDDRENEDRKFRAAVASGNNWNIDCRVVWPDGSVHWIESSGMNYRYVEGKSTRMLGMVRDITERKNGEEQLRQAKEQAESANQAKDTFLATLSHEMRTPLNAIIGWMSILRSEGCKEEDLQEGLDVIDRNTNAQLQLIEDVLDVSRIVSGKLRLEMRPCDLAEPVKAGLDVVRPAAEAKSIRLDATLDPSTHPVGCDPSRIQQIVWNLLSNAVKFTPKGGRVSVSLSREQSSVMIRVSDTGVGINPELLPHVFDRFRQAENGTRRKYGGLGLGLSIVKHLVEAHGGTVHAHSEGEGRGSTFTVELPIRAVRIEEPPEEPRHEVGEPGMETETQSTPPAPALPPLRLDGLHVLVVDDEPDARRLLAKVLEQAGATVTTADSAADALKRLQGNLKPDVLVSDLGMPDMDGYDLIREVRASGHTVKELPAVALTAYASKGYANSALLAGFQVHVTKPVDPQDLITIVASLTGRTGGRP